MKRIAGIDPIGILPYERCTNCRDDRPRSSAKTAGIAGGYGSRPYAGAGRFGLKIAGGHGNPPLRETHKP